MIYYNNILGLWTVFLAANYVKLVFCECTTPDGQAGECKILTDCETIPYIRNLNKTRQQWAFLREAQCGFQDKMPKICCPLSKKVKECENGGIKGECRDIMNCTPIMSAIQTLKWTEIFNYISTHTTGCNGAANLTVCCPMSSPVQSVRVQPVSTATPTSAPTTSSIQPTPTVPSQLNARYGACSATPLPPDPSSGCCGIDASSVKIVGGSETELEQYPWLALIEYRRRNNANYIDTKCGGSLISGVYVLTAAHCVDPVVVEPYIPTSVRLGEHDTRSDIDCVVEEDEDGEKTCNEDGAISVPIKKIIRNALYQPRLTSWHDIALLRLNRTVTYSYFIRPICLPSPNAIIPSELVVAGWGATTNGTASPVKMHVKVPYVRMSTCTAKFHAALQLWAGQICAGGVVGKDACKGDSGGPLMHFTGNQFVILGIVSYGTKLCGTVYPGVYTNVIEYLHWIKINMHD